MTAIQSRGRDGLTKAQRDALEPLVTDIEWRFANLYNVVDEHGQARRFSFRPAQRRLFDELRRPGAARRRVILKARQLGFTTFIDLFALDLALWNRNIRVGIVAHTREDAGIIFRDKIQYAYQHAPAFVRSWFPAKKNDAGEILFGETNSSVRVGTSFRSATAQLLHVSEYGAICSRYPAKASEIKTGSLPAVHDRGYVFIESTAKGNEGEFYDMCQRAQQDRAQGRSSPLSFAFDFFSWHDNPEYTLAPDGIVIPARLDDYFDRLQVETGRILTPAQRAWYAETERNLGADMKSEHPSTPAEAFEVSIEGAFYKTQMDRAYADGRIGEGFVDPALPVHVAWDIGHADATALWFFQAAGDELRLVDYYESSGEGMGHYVGVLRARGYNYGRHFGPHDLQVHEWTSGKSRIETAAAEYGIRFQVAPNVPVADGIEIVRQTLPRCWFNESRCEAGIKALTNYRKDWDADKGTWKQQPRHDWASHGADSFRYLCLCWRQAFAGDPVGRGGLVAASAESPRWGF